MFEVKNCLPEMLTGEKLDVMLKILPEYDESVRKRSIPERLIALQDIYKIFLPNQMSREIYAKLYLSLLRSLQKKQSIAAIRQSNVNNQIIRQQSYESIIGGADSFTIIGPSGIGKSSAVSRAVRLLLNDAFIELDDTRIVPCLTVQAPADGSVKGLLFEILRKADEVLGTTYQENAIRSRATTDILIGSVSQVALNHIGLLIVDEIQNIVNSKNGKSIVGMLTQLINNSGVSICMVGTPEATAFFDQAMMLARRSLGLIYGTVDYGEEYTTFCKTMLGYIYTEKDVDISEGMIQWIYNHTVGNVSVTVNLIHDAQEIAILDGYEVLNMETLKLAYDKRLAMLHGYISPEKIKLPAVKRKNSNPTGFPAEHEKDSDTTATTDVISQAVLEIKENHGDVTARLKAVGVMVLEVAI